MSSIGTYTLIRNEQDWIAPHLLSWLPVVDQAVFFDGNSTDGTLDIIKAIKKDSEHGHKITLVEDRDPKDLKDDYVRMFNACLWTLKTDWAIFAHPDMVISKGDAGVIHRSNAMALFCKMRSFAGEPGGPLLEITGRQENWKNITRLHNPNMGAHYFGHYGAWNEDTYFSEITGNDHTLYAEMSEYPYEVEDSGLEILHFSDVRPYQRRLSRMKTCLENQGKNAFMGDDGAKWLAENHPRVTLKDFGRYKFIPAEYPKEFLEAKAKYQHLIKEPVTA